MDYTVYGILQARILEWVAFPFSRGSSQPRNGTQAFYITGGFFNSWAPREAQEYWSGQSIPSPGDFSGPGIKPGSPALQANSLPAELPGKPSNLTTKSLGRELQRNFPGGSDGKKSVCNVGDLGSIRFDPWIRKIPWRRKWQPIPVFLPGEFHGQRHCFAYKGPCSQSYSFSSGHV